jgi:flagellar protein FlaJ
MEDIYKQAFRLFAPVTKKFSKLMPSLNVQLRKARISTPAEHWLAFCILCSVLALIISFIVSFIFALGLQASLTIFVIVVPLVSLCTSLVTGVLIYFYPAIIADERKKRIENALAFGTLYLAALARAGLPLPQMFKMMSSFKEYGELSREAGKISNDIEILGLDAPEAMSRAIKNSPSPGWSELLVGLKTALTVGGDLAKYLDEKAKGFVDNYKRRLSEFGTFLSMLVEIYITLVIVGVIFFIVITSVMSSIGAVPVQLLKTLNMFVVAAGIPMLTAVFILIAKGASPLED